MTEARPFGTLPAEFLADATPTAKGTFRDLLRQAGIRMRSEGGRLTFRNDTSSPSLLMLKPLQRQDDGAIRRDASTTLHSGDILDDRRAGEASQEFRSRYADFIPSSEGKAKKIPPTSFDAFQMELMWNVDDLAVITRWVDELGPRVRMYRAIASRGLHLRDMFWRVATTHLQEGLSLQRMLDDGLWPEFDQISGNVVVQPAMWIVAPSAARVQPFAAALSTVRGAELVLIPRGVWNRDSYQPLLWPIGYGGLRLGGPGTGAYQREGDSTIPHSVATDLLLEQCDGTNRLIAFLTHPGEWTTDPDRTLNVEERNIAWSTINLGFTAVGDIAKHWGSDSSLWSAFNALSILAGYWTRAGEQGVTIRQLVTPSVVAAHAVPALRPDWVRDWYRDVVDNWDGVLSEMYPGATQYEAAGAIQELRNLVHGTGAIPHRTRSRGARLLALASTGEANLQIIRDIATAWWMALLQNPETHARPGEPPF